MRDHVAQQVEGLGTRAVPSGSDDDSVGAFVVQAVERPQLGLDRPGAHDIDLVAALFGGGAGGHRDVDETRIVERLDQQRDDIGAASAEIASSAVGTVAEALGRFEDGDARRLADAEGAVVAVDDDGHGRGRDADGAGDLLDSDARHRLSKSIR